MQEQVAILWSVHDLHLQPAANIANVAKEKRRAITQMITTFTNNRMLPFPTTASIDSSSSGSDDVLARLVQAAVRKSLAANPESVAFSAISLGGTSFVRNSMLAVVGKISDDEISALSCEDHYSDASDSKITDVRGENDIPAEEDTSKKTRTTSRRTRTPRWTFPIDEALVEKLKEELNGSAGVRPSREAKMSDDILARLVKMAVSVKLAEYQRIFALSSFELPDDASSMTDETCWDFALSSFELPDDASAMTDVTTLVGRYLQFIPDSDGVRPATT